jgi:RNase P/RNase MRP subunit p29
MKSSRDLLRQEFIGLNARIISPGIRKPVRGRIVDETRNMIRLETGGRELSISKKGSRIILALSDGEVDVLGDWIIGNPADRIKKKMGRDRI